MFPAASSPWSSLNAFSPARRQGHPALQKMEWARSNAIGDAVAAEMIPPMARAGADPAAGY